MFNLTLTDKDFPPNYINKKHPEDGKVTPYFTIKPEVFTYNGRLFLRTSFQVIAEKDRFIPQKVNDSYIPFTFLCDMNMPGDFYFSKETALLLRNRIIETESDKYILATNTKKELKVEENSFLNPDINIIGVSLLKELGLNCKCEDDACKFEHMYRHNWF